MKKIALIAVLVSSFPMLIRASDCLPILALKASAPQVLSAEIGILTAVDTDRQSWSSKSEGLALSVEPGLRGTKLHLGRGGMGGGVPGYIYSGRVSLTYLKMTDDMGPRKSGDNCIGLEVCAGVGLMLNAGFLIDMKTNAPVLTAGIGIGL